MQTTMTPTTNQLAERAAEIFRERLVDYGDLLHECITEAMEEANIDYESDEAWDLCMDIATRVTVVAVN